MLNYSHHIPVPLKISLPQFWSIEPWDYMKKLLIGIDDKNQLQTEHTADVVFLWEIIMCAYLRWIPIPHNAVFIQLNMFAWVIQMRHFISKDVSGTNQGSRMKIYNQTTTIIISQNNHMTWYRTFNPGYLCPLIGMWYTW